MFDSKWTVNQVEEMDIFEYLDLLAYKINNSNENKSSKEKEIYIDDITWL